MYSYSKRYKSLIRAHEVSLIFIILLGFWCSSVKARNWKYMGSGDNGIRSRSSNQYVSLYEHENYRGKVHRQPVAKECSNVPRSYNDWASSIVLHDRCVTVCEHRDCQGPCANIIPNEKGRKKLSALGLNDKISSVKTCNQFF